MGLIEAFRSISPGDIFLASYHGHDGGAGNAICLVTTADMSTVTAKTVTTHMEFVFDRATLTASCGIGNPECVVVSTSTLPEEIHKIMLELSWKYDPTNPIKDPKLTQAQIDALIFVEKHYEN